MPQATQHYWPGPIEWKFTSDTGGWVALRKTVNDFIGQPVKQWTGGLTGVVGAEGTWDGVDAADPQYTNPKMFCHGPRFHPDSEDPTKSFLAYSSEKTSGTTIAGKTFHIVSQATDDNGMPANLHAG